MIKANTLPVSQTANFMNGIKTVKMPGSQSIYQEYIHHGCHDDKHALTDLAHVWEEEVIPVQWHNPNAHFRQH